MLNSMIKPWNGGGSLLRSAGGSLPRSSGGCLERSSGGYLSGISTILCLGVLLFSIAIYFQNQNVYLFNSSINRVLYFGFPAALIILGAVVLEHFRKINISIIFLNLGDASYSIYLFHLPIVVAFLKLLNHYNIVSEIIIYCLIVVLVVIIYLAGVIIYKNIETPLLKYFNKKI